MAGFQAFIFALVAAIFCSHQIFAEENISSIEQMQDMIEVEKQLIIELEKYIVVQEKRVDMINKYVSKLEMLVADAEVNGILHPAWAFLHTVALSVDLDELMANLAADNAPEEQLEKILKLQAQTAVQDEIHLMEAAKEVDSLRLSHNITVQQFVDGKWDWDKSDTDTEPPFLTVGESFDVGRKLFEAENYDSSHDWFQYVLRECGGKVNSSATDATEDCSGEMIALSMARNSYVSYIDGNVTAAILQAAEALTFSNSTRGEIVEYIKIYYMPPLEEVSADTSSNEIAKDR